MVEAGNKYRFRTVCASMTFAFRLRVDGHRMHVIGMDGAHVTTTSVESVIVYPGERMDFWIEADDPLQQGLYWIRATNLEYKQNNQVRASCCKVFRFRKRSRDG